MHIILQKEHIYTQHNNKYPIFKFIHDHKFEYINIKNNI
jgi:hypothetical protein